MSRRLNGLQKDLRAARTRFAEERAVRRIQEGIPRLLRTPSDLIVVGPWLSEVGFELLYWAPFVRKQLGRYKVDPERVLVISRGNASGWYQPFTGRYVDIFDLCTPREFYEANRQRDMEQHNGKKHVAVCEIGRAHV